MPFQHAMVFDVSQPPAAPCSSRGGTARSPAPDSADQPVWIVPVRRGQRSQHGLRAYGGGVVARRRARSRSAAAPATTRRARRRRCSRRAPTAPGSQAPRRRPCRSVMDPRWSPDGSRLRFAVVRPRARPSSGGWRSRRRGPAPRRRVVRGEAGDWSPDGRHFVVRAVGTLGGQRAVGGPALQPVRAARGGGWSAPAEARGPTEPLTFGPMDLSRPGRSLPTAGSSSSRGSCGEWTCCASSRATGPVRARAGGRLGRLRRLLARRRVGLVGRRDPPHAVAGSRRDGTGQLQLTVPPRPRAALAHWSPDGRRLVFVADPTGGRQPRAVYVVSRDGGRDRVLRGPEQLARVGPVLAATTSGWSGATSTIRGSVKTLDLRTAR